jgi:addiction module RelE/StbE family toxin
MRVKWLLVALDDLHQAGQYIAKSSPAAATKVIDRISKATRMLSDQPGIGRPGRVMGTRELVVTGTFYIIPYRVVEDVVQILRILHSSKRWPNRF